MYFPDDIWNLIKEFQGFKKYYVIPCNLKEPLFHNLSLQTFVHNRLFRNLLTFLYSCQRETISVRMMKIFDFLLRHMHLLQIAREVSMIWDRFAFTVASQCQNYQITIHCGCNSCDKCFTHDCIEYISRTFYTEYSHLVMN